MIKSPCIKYCVFDYEGNFCTGCYRRLEDISGWGFKSDDEKIEIIERANELKQEKEQEQLEKE